MIAEEVIYNLRTLLAEEGSTLVNKTDQHLMFMLDEARSILISRKIDNQQNVESFSQFYDVTPLAAPSSILGTVNEKTPYVIECPTPVSLSHGVGITSLGPTDGSIEYGKIDYGRLKTALHKKYTSQDTKWFYDNGKIIIINATFLVTTKVRVRGYFDEPWRIAELNGKTTVFRPFNFLYPASNKDLASIYSIAMSGDLSWGDTAVQLINRQKQAQQRQEQSQQRQNQENAES